MPSYPAAVNGLRNAYMQKYVPKAATTDQTGSHRAGTGSFSGCISDDAIGGFMELVLGDYEWFEVVAKVFEIKRFHVGDFAHVVVFTQNHC